MMKTSQNNDLEEWFRLLVNSYREKVIRFISHFVNDRLLCEEIASDVFVTIWLHRNALQNIDNLDSYLFIIAKNKALNHLRSENNATIDLDSVHADAFCFTETTPESVYISNETVRELNKAVNELPTRTKLAFLLIREHKKSYKEAADIMSVSVKTIEKQVASAVEKLKEKLKYRK
jgi:RNA polymerase sigma-70 factor (ECF subfamily)